MRCRVVVVLCAAVVLTAADAARARDDGVEPMSNTTLKLATKTAEFTFDSASGALISFRSLPLKREMLQSKGMFEVMVGGATLGPDRWRLADVDVGANERLRLTFEIDGDGPKMRAVQEVRAADATDSFETRLTVENLSDEPTDVGVTFPSLGLAIGESSGEDIILDGNRWGQFLPIKQLKGTAEWQYGEGFDFPMQWHAQYSEQAGYSVGIIAEDSSCGRKVFRAGVGPTMSVSFESYPLAAGQRREYPLFRILRAPGDWRATAEAYREWFLDKFELTEPPDWLRYDGFGFLNAMENFGDRDFSMFNDLGDFDRVINDSRVGGPSTGEFHGWTEATALAKLYNCGDYYPRNDMGGGEALRDGLRRLHEIGGRMIVYVEGMLTWVGPDCLIDRTGKPEKWSMMNADGTYARWYQDRWHCCPAVPEWQDYLASKCAEIIREYGADGVRLDSLGATGSHLCYNPGHAHYPKPDVWNEGVRELLRKVRAAMKEVNPEAVLLCEGSADYYFESIDASFGWTYEIGFADRSRPHEAIPVRWTLPELTLYPLSLDGNPRGINVRLAKGLPWNYFGGEFDRELARNWFYARHLLKEALVDGRPWRRAVTTDLPGQVLAEGYSADDYSVIVKAAYKGEDGPVTLKFVPDRPLEQVYVLDVANFDWHGVDVASEGGKAVIPLGPGPKCVLVPGRQAPAALVFPKLRPMLAGSTLRVPLNLLGGDKAGKLSARLMAPGLIVNGRKMDASSEIAVDVPGEIQISAPAVDRTSRYRLQLTPAGSSRFLAHPLIVQVNPPLSAFADVLPEGRHIVAKVRLRNSTDQTLHAQVSLTRPSSWGMEVSQITVPAAREVTHRVALMPAELQKDESGLDFLVDYEGGQTTCHYNTTQRFSLETCVDYNVKNFIPYRADEMWTGPQAIDFDLLGSERYAVREWHVRGPFDNGSLDGGVWGGAFVRGEWPGDGIDRDFLASEVGEAALTPEDVRKAPWRRVRLAPASIDSLRSGEVTWEQYRDSLRLDLSKVLQCSGAAAAYAATVIESDGAQKRMLLVRGHPGMQVWLNGASIYRQTKVWDISNVYTVRLPLDVQSGQNLVLIKLVNKPGGYWTQVYGLNGSELLAYVGLK